MRCIFEAINDDDEFDNELSPEEDNKFIAWGVVISRQKQLERQFYLIQNKQTKQAYELNNKLLLLSYIHYYYH